MPQFHRLRDIGICSLALEDAWHWRYAFPSAVRQDKMTFQLCIWRPLEPEDGIDNYSRLSFTRPIGLGRRKI